MERESIEMDVLFVGAGPASLSGALHLSRLVSEYNEAVEKGTRKGKPLGEIQIAVIEKGSTVGSHILSGAVMDPKALKELIPDFLEQGAPVESPVNEDYFLYLTKTRAIKSPVTPPPLKNHGYYVVSLNKLTAWLGEKCEEAGVTSSPSSPAPRCSTTTPTASSACARATRASTRRGDARRTSSRAWTSSRR